MLFDSLNVQNLAWMMLLDGLDGLVNGRLVQGVNPMHEIR